MAISPLPSSQSVSRQHFVDAVRPNPVIVSPERPLYDFPGWENHVWDMCKRLHPLKTKKVASVDWTAAVLAQGAILTHGIVSMRIAAGLKLDTSVCARSAHAFKREPSRNDLRCVPEVGHC